MIGRIETTQVLIGLLLFALGLIFHSYNLDFASLDLDESVHVWHAQKSYTQVVEQASNDPNPPVFNVVISWWVKHFGVDERVLRSFSVLMGSLAVVLMYVIGLRNFSMAAGIMAALLFCASPMVFRFTHLIRPYMFLMVTVVSSYALLFEVLKRPRWWKTLLYYFLTTLMIYVHPTSIFNVPAQALIVLVVVGFDVKRLLAVWIPMAMAVASFGAYYLFIPYFEGESTEMWFDAPDWQAVWYVLNVFYGKWYLMAIQLVLIATLVVASIRKRFVQHWKWVSAIVLWIVLPLTTSVVFSHMVKPVFQDKYVLSALPGMLLLLAVSIDLVLSNWYKLLAFVPSLVVSLSYVRYQPFTEGDWKNAVAYINQDFDSRSAVFLVPWYEFTTFTYYNDPEAYVQTDSTMKYMVQKRVLWAWHDIVWPGDSIAKFDRLYLVKAHGDYVDFPFSLDSLDRNADLLESRTFSGIELRKYQLNKRKP